jgi:adenylate cyclase
VGGYHLGKNAWVMKKQSIRLANSFYEELKRRKVIRSAIAYLVGAWMLLQVGDVVIEPLGLPAWIQPTLIIGLAGLFPVVLIVAWIYELTSSGFVRETELDMAAPEETEVASSLVKEQGRPRLAVVPFANLSSSTDDDYLGEGIAEEILNTVAGHKQLEVVASASSFRFRGADIDIAVIREKLAATHVITGSIRRAEEKLLISVQLIETASEIQVWAETYKRTSNDLFQVQADIARGVSDQFLATMGLDAIETLRDWKLIPEAYEQYLMATAAFRRADFPSALKYAAKSEEIDPDNPLVPTLIAEVYLNWPQYGFVTTKDELSRAHKHARRALKIDADYLPAQSAMGMLSLYMNRDFGAAFEAVAHSAIERPELTVWLPPLLSYADRYGDAVELQCRMAQQDPLNTVNLLTWACRLNWLGRWDEAVIATQRARELDPTNLILSNNDYRWAIRDGNYDKAKAMLRRWGLDPDKPGDKRPGSWLPRSIGLWLGARLYGELDELDIALALAHEIELEEGFTPTTVAEAYISAGAIDDAYRIWDLGISRFDPGAYDLARPHHMRERDDRFWLKFSNDPRFEEFLGRLGIDEASLLGIDWRVIDKVLR